MLADDDGPCPVAPCGGPARYRRSDQRLYAMGRGRLPCRAAPDGLRPSARALLLRADRALSLDGPGGCTAAGGQFITGTTGQHAGKIGVDGRIAPRRTAVALAARRSRFAWLSGEDAGCDCRPLPLPSWELDLVMRTAPWSSGVRCRSTASAARLRAWTATKQQRLAARRGITCSPTRPTGLPFRRPGHRGRGHIDWIKDAFSVE
jgi:hypothetical protein